MFIIDFFFLHIEEKKNKWVQIILLIIIKFGASYSQVRSIGGLSSFSLDYGWIFGFACSGQIIEDGDAFISCTNWFG